MKSKKSSDNPRDNRHIHYLIACTLAVCAVSLAVNTFLSPGLDPKGTEQTTTVSDDAPFKSSFAVNINKATKEELLGLKGMSEAMADSIIEYRNIHGRFTDI